MGIVDLHAVLNQLLYIKINFVCNGHVAEVKYLVILFLMGAGLFTLICFTHDQALSSYLKPFFERMGPNIPKIIFNTKMSKVPHI